jgi:hypothetical protein
MEKIYIIRFLARKRGLHGFYEARLVEYTIRMAATAWPSSIKVHGVLDDGGYHVRALRSITAEGV